MWFDSPITGRSLAPRSLVLSFDDGPGPDTVEMGAYLAEENIQAMFFAVGKRVRQFPDRVMRLRELGHTVGNHSENHIRLTDCWVTDEAACAEFTAAAGALGQSEFFRPPYGAWNGHLAHLFKSQPGIRLAGTGPVNWDIYGGDYHFWRDKRSADACAHSYAVAIERRKKGIVLFHDFSADDPLAASGNRTFEAIRLLIPRLRDMGYRFCSANDIPALNDGRIADDRVSE
jgi:peptidoglycan/xylan/chitin deacetylase (PgdA/CDA1 family)